MSLEGLRAWIGEVERKLGVRTRVFLVLTVIAIGLGGAAIYLAIDARESSVSESDVQALQEELETRIDEVGASAATPPAEAESAPEPEEQTPKPETGKNGSGSGGTGGGAPEGSSGGAAGTLPNSATGGAPSSARLQELLEKTKKRGEQIEREEAAGK